MHSVGVRLARRAAFGTTFAALLLASTACAGSPTTSEATKASASASSTASAQPATRHSGTRSACSQVKDVFVHLAGVSAGWDPARDPFDTRTADEFGPLVHQLRTEADSASSSRLRAVVVHNADALSDLAAAMRSHQQQRVTAALADSRRAYAALPSCARRGVRTAHATASASTGGTTGGSTGAPPVQTARADSAAAKDPGCIGAKAAYADLGPVTSTWDITSDPFDAEVARAFRDTADALDDAAAAANDSGVATKVKSNAAAFRLLADSIGSKDAAEVDDSVITMQQTAVTLAATCPLS